MRLFHRLLCAGLAASAGACTSLDEGDLAKRLAEQDLDGDGFPLANDCDDGDAAVNPGAVERCDSPADDDCDGQANPEGTSGCDEWYADEDGDGFGGDSRCLCEAEGDYSSSVGGDCDDTPGMDGEHTFPGAAEAESDEACMLDADEDGFGAAEPTPGVDAGTDCDDRDVWANPEAEEACDGVDDDCDGDVDEQGAEGCDHWYLDEDDDSYGSTVYRCLCEAAAPYDQSDSLDCDDGDASVHPGATELCNGGDDDCDGSTSDEAGKVSKESGSTWSDLTSSWTGTSSSPKSVTLPTSGTVHVCSGTFYVNITASGGTVAVEGEGEGVTVLDGARAGHTFYASSATVVLTDLTLTGAYTSAGVYGGNLLSSNSDLSAVRVAFTDGEAPGGAGAYVYGGTADFEDCEFSGNVGNSGAGALFAYQGAYVLCTRVDFEDNEGVIDGGAVAVSVNSSVILDACTLSSNTAQKGGAIALKASDAEVSLTGGTTVTYNTATYGGGVYLDEGGTFTCESSDINYNTASSKGGGAYLADSSDSLSSTSCDWLYNSPTGDDVNGAGFNQAYSEGSNETFTCTGTGTCTN